MGNMDFYSNGVNIIMWNLRSVMTWQWAEPPLSQIFRQSKMTDCCFNPVNTVTVFHWRTAFCLCLLLFTIATTVYSSVHLSHHLHSSSSHPPLLSALGRDAIFPADLLILNDACKLLLSIAGFIYLRIVPLDVWCCVFVSRHCAHWCWAAPTCLRWGLTLWTIQHIHLISCKEVLCAWNVLHISDIQH